MATTITEALADLKTIDKRLAAKRQFVATYLLRPNVLVDPLIKEEGGSEGAIKRELQAIHDLEERKVAIRRAITKANAETSITVNGQTRTVNDWLVWRRDVAPGAQQFLGMLRDGIKRNRDEASKKGVTVTDNKAESKPSDVVVNISEAELYRRIEGLEEVLGVLDGQLSLRNATVLIEA